jgi:membrane-associated phospholipid phosphatase
MSNIIAGTLLAILTGIFIVWFFKKLTDISTKNLSK